MADKPLKAPLGATQQQGGEQEAGIAVIVGELTSFVAHIATCHSNLDGTTTLPASVKASAINITERCNMTELVYTALRTKQPAANSSSNELVEVAEVYLHSWYDSSPGCNSMREELELKFLGSGPRPPVGTKLYMQIASNK